MFRTASTAPRLIGRDAELAILRQAARPGRMVAVTGPPGVGKTALITELVSRLDERPESKGRAIQVSLEHARSTEDLWAALGRALGISLDQAERAAARLGRTLQGVGIVVLDAAEQLDEPAWKAIDRLRQDCPGTLWIAGSVVAPPVADQQLQLEPLSLESTRAMLLSRAADRALGRPIDGADPAWTKLAERLDGLPLAVELAAGRLSLLSPAELLDRLEVAVLRGEDRRHSVEGALRFTWSLLHPREKAALVALSPLSGGFVLPVAEGLLGLDAIPMLEALRSRSAVVARGRRLYVLEGLRRIAAEQADAQVLQRFVAFWGDEAARLRALSLGIDPITGIRTMLDEYKNLRAAYDLARDRDPLAAVRIAIALVTVLRHHGPLWELDALGDLEATARAAPPAEAADLLSIYGGVLMHLGRMRQVRPVLEAAIAHGDRAGEKVHGKSVALSEIGWMQLIEGDLDGARSTYQQAIEAAPGPLARAMALIRLAAVERAAHDHGAATRALELALTELEGNLSPRLRGGALHNLGVARGEQRRYVEAGDLLERSMRDLKEIDRVVYASALINRELLRLVTGEGANSGRIAEAMELLTAFGSGMTAGLGGIVAALERWAAGDHPAARERLVEAGARLASVDPRGAATVRAWRAALEADTRRGEPGRAGSLRAELDAALADGAEPGLVAVLAVFGGDEPPPETPVEALEIQAGRRLLDRSPAALRLDREGRWFEHSGNRVSLARRGSLRRILAALVELRATKPGTGLTVDGLFEAGWPGEKAQPEAAAGRVYNAIRELRNMGLGDLLRREAEGYLLDPGAHLEIVG